MKTNKLRLIAVLLVPAMLSLSTAQAAQPVQWNDLPQKIGLGGGDRQYRVVTKDGAVHAAYDLAFSPSGITVLPSGSSIPREQAREIRIHRVRHLADALLAPAGKVFESGGDDLGLILSPVVLLMIPVAIGITAVTAPIVLPIECIKRLLPDKVIKVAQ